MSSATVDRHSCSAAVSRADAAIRVHLQTPVAKNRLLGATVQPLTLGAHPTAYAEDCATAGEMDHSRTES